MTFTPADQTRIVANSASETYVQTSASCMDCHQSGGIAQKSNQSTLRAGGHEKRRVLVGDVAGAAPQQKSYASDYSFLFATDTNH